MKYHTGALPIATVSDVPAHRAVPGRSASVVSIVTGSPLTSSTTLDANWNAWNQVYTITQRYEGCAATTANAYALQRELTNLMQTWTAWNVSYTSSVLTATNAVTTITTATTNAGVWGGWNDVYAVEAANRENQVRRDIVAGKRPSTEQQEKWRQEEIARKLAEENRRKAELTAKEKAEVLLLSCLSPQQREEYKARNCFHLHVGEKKYRIEKGSHGNVKLVDKNGVVKRSFCVQPRGVPDGDTMLAQKLMLESDEKRFYEIANVSEHDANGAAVRTLHAPRGAELLREVLQGAG